MLKLAKIIDLLDQTEYISGEDLAEQLGVTRAAVWKQIEVLRELGYEIKAFPRKGYLLCSKPDKLYPWEIGKGLKTQLIGKNMEYYDELPSTNLQAKKMLGSLAEGTVIMAESQTKGRGRLGRNWFSPPGVGIWMSLLLAPKLPPAELSKLTLVAAVALSRTIFEVLGVRPLVKWPNDLYLEGRKISGILTELVGEMGRLEYLILGVGINANQKPEDFPEELRDKAGSLAMVCGGQIDRKVLLRRYLEVMEEEYFQALKEGFDHVLDYCRKYTFTLGRKVVVNGGVKTLSGTAVEIAEDGSLILEKDGEKFRVITGDVNLINKERE